jgi:hypothetical protein
MTRAEETTMATPEDDDPVERQRIVLVKCIEEAYDSLRLMPGLDANGPALVWLAGKILQAKRKAGRAD